MNYLLTLTSIFLATQALAHDHDHDRANFPEGALFALEGRDAIAKEECHLFVMAVQNGDNFSARVLTSYAHGHDKPAPIEVKVSDRAPNALTGTGANGQDQIAIFLEGSSTDLRRATGFNLKWLHGNHFHTNRCTELRVHQH